MKKRLFHIFINTKAIGLVLSLLFIVSSFSSNAQWVSLKRNSDYLYQNGAWNTAIPKLKRQYKNKPINDVLRKVAESYLSYRQFDSAAVWYGKFLPDFGTDSTSMQNYARTLLALGNYSKARLLLKDYIRKFNYSSEVKVLLQSCDSPVMLPDLRSSVSINLEKNNSKNNDFSPVWYKNQLYYCTSRKATGRNFDGDGKPFIRIFRGKQNLEEDFIVKSRYQSISGAPRTHLGPFTFYGDNKMLATANTSPITNAGRYQSKIALLNIFEMELDGNKGMKLGKPFPHNDPKYSSAHPAVSPNGKHLIFVSDRAGTAGFTDLYYCSATEDGSWSEPVNMGPSVNTFNAEMFPSFTDDTTVYFSSNGRPGFGGLDIFKARFKNGALSNIKNIGQPYNSPGDDFGLTFINPEEGFLSSNRAGGSGGDDIYHFRSSSCRLNVIVMNATKNVPIEQARVRVNGTDIPVPDFFTAQEGKSQVNVITNKPFELIASKRGFLPGRLRVAINFKKVRDTTVIINLYEGNSCFISGVVTDANGNSLEGALVSLIDTTNLITELATTGPDGTYEFAVKPGATVDITVSKPGSFTVRQPSVKLAETGGCDRNFNFKLGEVIANKTLAIENIYYDYDKWNLRDESILSLEKVRKVLVDNPTLMLEVSSHTDMRGTSRYNDELSVRRAEIVIEYLVMRGISIDRLTYKVYGKIRPAIPCERESDCSEAKHQMNRRTEFKVLYF